MDSSQIFLIVFFTPLILFCIGIAGMLVFHLTKQNTLYNVCKCMALWLTLFFFFPGQAKESGFIKNKIVGWIIALVAPPLLVLYCFVYGTVTMDNPLSYDELPYTSHREIAAITDIPDFPKFEYQYNEHHGWDGSTRIFYKFSNDKEASKLLAHLDLLIGDEDNIYWRKDSVQFKEDRDFFGCDVIYICERGWDSLYVKKPNGVSADSQVCISVGKKGFTVISSGCYLWGIEDYANPDTLNNLTGVDFPHIEFVNGSYSDYYIDSGWDATAKMKKKPTKSFLNSLEKAKHWSKLKDGTYKLNLQDRKGDLLEDIYVDPNSCYVRFSHSSH